MTGKDIYKIYAPFEAKWTNWVRPVPFVAIDTYNRKNIRNLVERKISFIDKYQSDIAIFVDLPNIESIEYGIALARIGYRPIPVFNGVDEQVNATATTNTYIVEESLISGAQKLEKIKIEKNANPVFLLDSQRTNRYRKNESIFDNSWDLYGQDIPSPDYFKKNGINKIIIIGEKIQKDLRKIFFKFDKEFEFFITDGYSSLKRIVLKKTIKEHFQKEEL